MKNIIETYEVFFEDVLIGILKVDISNKKHLYEPNKNGIEKVNERACLLKVMINGTNGFEELIPFFENRLYNMRRSNLRQVNYQTDKYTVKRILDGIMTDLKYNEKENRAEAYDCEMLIGECDYIEQENTWNIIHTEVNNNYQGQGIARKLVECIIENAKIKNKNLIADCSYAKKVLEEGKP